MILELHRPSATDRISAQGLDVEIVANADECAAIAARLGIPAVHALRCNFSLRRSLMRRNLGGQDGVIVAEGRMRAELVRECVVSLDPFPVRVDEKFRILFVPAGTESEDDDPDSDDEIPYDGAAIDLGEAAVEQLALTLDPYPHKPGATLPDAASDPDLGPFAALARHPRRE